MKNLGFGMMRLPVKGGPTDFDYDELDQMVDEFIAGGYTYFDTSYVYHNGKSQEAARSRSSPPRRRSSSGASGRTTPSPRGRCATTWGSTASSRCSPA